LKCYVNIAVCCLLMTVDTRVSGSTRYPGTSYPFGTSTEAYGNVNEGGSAAPPPAQRILSELEFEPVYHTVGLANFDF